MAHVLGRVQVLHPRGLPGWCPTGSLFRTEFGTVVVQDDICNGCGVYGLPPDPVVTTRDLPDMWKKAGLAALATLGGAAASFVGGRS